MSLLNQKAPEFSLVNTDKEMTSLSDYTGKPVVVVFFPLAFTSVCTEELCSFRNSLDEYEKLGANIVAVSVDSPFTLEVFKKEQNLNFPLLSDFNKEVSKRYKCCHDTFPAFGLQGVSKRSIFVLDKDHTVVHEEILDNPGEMPDLDLVKKIVSKL